MNTFKMSNLAQNFIFNATNNLMLELNKPTMGSQCHNLLETFLDCPIEPYEKNMLTYIIHIFIKWHPFLWPFSSSLGHLTLALHPSLKDPKTWTQTSKVELPKLTIVVFFKSLHLKTLCLPMGLLISVTDLPRLHMHLPNVFTYLPNQLPNYLSYQPTYPLRLRTYLG
jgi:hypothetical protein